MYAASPRPLSYFLFSQPHLLRRANTHLYPFSNRKGQPTFEKTATGYVYHAFGFPGMAYAVSWIQHDLGQAFVALAMQYDTRPEEVLNQNFVIGIARPKVEDIVGELSKGE